MKFLAKNSIRQAVALFVVGTLMVAACPLESAAYQASPPPTQQATGQGGSDLDQLVAPIALYPDALVAQILGASTFPPR